MTIGFSGSPARGYDVSALIARIGEFLDSPESENAILVGIGNLGRAFLAYFAGRGSQFSIVAAVDNDPEKVNRVIHGCRCHPVEELPAVVAAQNIRLALNAVPAAVAQETANLLCSSGIRGIVNFAPVHIWVPEGVYVENVDVAMSVERVAYFARAGK
jgi:redox-sensing transcriptional repressor